ncbi:MAG: LuxR C-terminal-related transcriptional regulator [Chloroflexota bacterium]
MAELLLSTRLNIPHLRPDRIPRDRLVTLIERHATLPVVTITAPAGFGKTTVLAEWARQTKLPVSWLTLSSQDNDPTVFWSYFIASLQRTAPALGTELLERLRVPEPEAIHLLLADLINRIAAMDTPLAMVLDDYHLINDPDILSAMSRLVDYLPANFHLLIASRTAIAINASRMRARGHLFELDEAELRFNAGEVLSLLSTELGERLSASDIHTLHARTEGWAVGLQLFLLSLRNEEDLQLSIDNFSGTDRYIADYLLDEVLAHQPLEITDFLLKTACLERLSAPLCNNLLGVDHSQQLLKALEDRNLFIVPLDNQRRWYRYHHLFAELLLARLDSQFPALRPALYRRAALWHERHGFHEEAVHYAILSGDTDLAVRIIQPLLYPLLLSGKRKTIAGWLDALPDDLFATHPAFRDIYLFAIMNDSTWERQLEALERFGPSRTPVSGHPAAEAVRRGQISFLKAASAWVVRLDPVKAGQKAREGLAVLPPSRGYEWTLLSIMKGASDLMVGNLSEAAQTLTGALAFAETHSEEQNTVPILDLLGQVRHAQGRLAEAESCFRRGYEQAVSHGTIESPPVAIGLVGEAAVAYERGRVAHAYDLVNLGLAHCIPEFNVGHMFPGFELAMQIHLMGGDLAAAEHVLEDARLACEKSGSAPFVVDRVAVLAVRLALARGAVGEAVEMVQTHGFDTIDPAHAWRLNELLVVARTLQATAHYEDASDLLKMLYEHAQSSGRVNDQVHMGAALAGALYRHCRKEAVVYLREVFALGIPLGYRRAYQDADLPAELWKMASDGLAGGHRLDALRPDHSPLDRSSRQEQTGRSPKPDGLTPREVDVLEHLARGLPYAQVAHHLAISENTVKYHIKNIYSKLDVSNRTQAVVAAQQQQIL